MVHRPWSVVVAGPSAPSRFNLSIGLPLAGKAVLNTLTGALVVVGRDAWRRYLAPGCEVTPSALQRSSTARLLQTNGLLVPADLDELELLRVRSLSEQFRDSRLGVTIIPSLACNLRCSYCVQGDAHPVRAGAWTRDREDDVVRYVIAAARGKQALDVSWFGGEPLLALRTIRRISALLIGACDRAGVKYSASVVTNGTLLTPQVVKALRGCRLKFLHVTVDVPAGEKRDLRGGGTIESVLDRLAAAAAMLSVRLRVNVVRDDEAEFDALYAGLIRRSLHTRLESAQFAYVFEPECGPQGCGFSAMPYPAYVRTVRRERPKAAALGVPIDFSCQPETTGCAATRQYDLVIGPDGLLHKCTNDVGRADRAYGSVAAGAPVNLANLVPWLRHDCLQDERCARCPALPGCGGGCPHRRRFQPEQFDAMRFCESYLEELADRMRECVEAGGATIARSGAGRDGRRRPPV